MTIPLAEALAAGTVVMDGGLSTELESRGADVSSALWSARLLRDAPYAVVEGHAAFAAAGAQVLTTASYQATFPGLAPAGVGAAVGRELMTRSWRLGRKEVARAGRSGCVAASVGPY